MRATLVFEKPDGASVEDVARFIIDALSSWGGGLHPEDPMFHSLRGKMDFLTVNGRIFNAKEEARDAR